MGKVRRVFRRVAASGACSALAAGLLSLAVSAGLSAVRAPLPRVHDEFSYLLAADTFARGRLSNPSHPCWEHFETFHVLQRPRYASKYPPAQGLILAFGQAAFGRPIAGAWLGVALGTAAVVWMLRGWTRPRWALAGGLLTAVHPGLHGGTDFATGLFSWSQSYWGGGPAMTGGALVYGALPRLARRPAVGASLAFGLGLVVLANARPFEGVLAAAPAVFALIVCWLRGGAFAPGEVVRKFVAPVALVVVPAGGLMGVYFADVTGSPLRMPYAAYEDAYNPVPVFTAWHGPGPVPAYRHEVLKTFFTGWVFEEWACQQTFRGWWRYHKAQLVGWLWPFFVGPFVLPVLAVPAALRDKRFVFLAFVCLLPVAAHLTTVGIQPHYAAPVFGCWMVLVVAGLRRLAAVRVGTVRLGRGLARLTAVLVVAQLGVVATVRATAPAGWEARRAGIESALAAGGGRHLVVVRYGPDHDPLREWVWNRADIDGSPVVWAREMGPDMMPRLLTHFRGRSVWLLEPDADPPRLAPHGTSEAQGATTTRVPSKSKPKRTS